MTPFGRRLAWTAATGLAVGVVGVALYATSDSSPRPERAGVLLQTGPSAMTDPYGAAQGAVSRGEAVLLDFGEGELVFFVNRSEDVLGMVNGCGERVAPSSQRRLPVLVEAHFRVRSAPPYTVETPTTRYRFSSSGAVPCG